MKASAGRKPERKRLPPAAECALFAMMAGLAGFLPWLIADRGFLTLAYDYNHQQIPFAAAAYEGIRQLASGEWIWNLDLGSSVITGFGFYNLGSPFFWITLLFPKESFPYLAGFLYVLKYMTAAVLAWCWLKQYVPERSGALIGGLLYAFSGFQSTNLLFYHFHDAVAFFPLLLLGLDRLAGRKKSLLFPFAVFVNCLVNYTFFVQEAVFLAVYFLFRYVQKERITETLKLVLTVFSLAILGVSMAAFLFLPNVMYVLNSARGTGRIDLGRLLYGARETLFILKGFLLPGEAMTEESAVFQYQYGSTSLYIPFFGMSFVLVYLFQNKGWLRRLLITLILISFSPLIQSGFLLFTEPNQRWWYMLNLLCVLATVLVLDGEQYRARKAQRLVPAYCGFTLLYCLLLGLLRGPSGGTLVQSRELFLLFGGLAAVSSLCCWALIRKKSFGRGTALAAVVLACAVTTTAAIGAYKKGDDHDAVRQHYLAGLQLKTLDEQYRYDSSLNLLLMPGQGAGVGAFSSTAENSSYAFRSKVYDFNANFTYESIVLPGLPELLGARYVIEIEPEEGPLADSFEVEGIRFGITEQAACPIGFATENYITLEELHKVPVEERSYVLMDAVAVESPEKVQAYHERRWQGEDLSARTALIARTEARKVQSFRRNRSGFTCTANYDSDQLVFFSVPNDAGWTARIDEQRAEILDACGLMAISVPAGNHRISFSYHTPGLRAGVWMSALGWAVYLAVGLAGRRQKKRLP